MTFHPFTRSAVWMILTLALAWLRPPCAAQTEEASDHKTPGGERSYPFPARQDDLNPGEYWYRLKKAHRADIAELAYDLDAIRYDSKENVWTRYNPGVDSNAKVRDTEHSDWIVYGKKVYAIADGEVSGCWRNQPEGPAVGSTDRTAYLRFVGLPQSYFDFIPGAGNHLWVEHDDGSRALYGHFQPESIPTALRPFSETLPAPGENDQTKIPEGRRPKIKRGQHLGRVGSTGNSGNPHLHIQMGRDGDKPLRFHGTSVKGINNNPDAPSDWTRIEGEVLPPGPIAILPNSSEVPQGSSGNSEQSETRSRTNL